MNIRGQRFPHKYIQRVRKNGKWVYYYAQPKVGLSKATRGAESHSVVIAHGKPTQIMVDPKTSDIVYGPPNIVGRKLYVNQNTKKKYFAIAKDPMGNAPDTYLYPESVIESVAAKKAAKFVKSSRALELLDRHAETLMKSSSPVDRDYGLAIWLNNNSQMRIGAGTGGSIDPKERAAILTQARKENWGPETKHLALRAARKPTFGLMSLRMGHVSLERGGGRNVTFRFIGKGGKENVYVTPTTPRVYDLLFLKKYGQGRQDDDPLFDARVNYKHLWRTYKRYGTTPHASRGVFAEHLVKQLMQDFKVFDGESASAAVRRFNQALSAQVSKRLNHTRSMTERSYLTETTRQAVNQFRDVLRSRVGHFRESATSDPITDALGEAVLWLHLGAGNTVI